MPRWQVFRRHSLDMMAIIIFVILTNFPSRQVVFDFATHRYIFLFAFIKGKDKRNANRSGRISYRSYRVLPNADSSGKCHKTRWRPAEDIRQDNSPPDSRLFSKPCKIIKYKHNNFLRFPSFFWMNLKLSRVRLGFFINYEWSCSMCPLSYRSLCFSIGHQGRIWTFVDKSDAIRRRWRDDGCRTNNWLRPRPNVHRNRFGHAP